MLYVDETAEAWSKKHGLDIEVMECSACKKSFPVNVPIVIKGYKGFEMQKHGCPDNRLAANFTPVGKEKDFWNRFINEPVIGE